MWYFCFSSHNLHADEEEMSEHEVDEFEDDNNDTNEEFDVPDVEISPGMKKLKQTDIDGLMSDRCLLVYQNNLLNLANAVVK